MGDQRCWCIEGESNFWGKFAKVTLNAGKAKTAFLGEYTNLARFKGTYSIEWQGGVDHLWWGRAWETSGVGKKCTPYSTGNLQKGG